MSEKKEQLNINDLINFPVHYCVECLQLEDSDEKAVFKNNRFPEEKENRAAVGAWIAETLNGAAEREAENERLRQACETVLHHIASHQVYDKDSARTLRMALLR